MFSRLVLYSSRHLLSGRRPSLCLGRRLFSEAKVQGLVPSGNATIKKGPEVFREQELKMQDGRKIDLKFNDHTVCYELPERVGGATYDTHGQYMIMFTCKKCDTKQSKFFTKNAYHQGVVLVRCDGCSAFHLIADNLGWFGDDKTNIETIMKEKNEEMIIGNADPELLRILKMDIDKTRGRLDEEQRARRPHEEDNNRQETIAPTNETKI